MELKSYQYKVIQDLEQYLEYVQEHKKINAISTFQWNTKVKGLFSVRFMENKAQCHLKEGLINNNNKMSFSLFAFPRLKGQHRYHIIITFNIIFDLQKVFFVIFSITPKRIKCIYQLHLLYMDYSNQCLFRVFHLK